MQHRRGTHRLLRLTTTVPWRIVAAFAVTQTIGYGCMLYAFAVLLRPMTADLGLSTATVTGGMTVATLVWAAMAVPVGRWLDRHGGRVLMTTGSLLGGGFLVAWSRVEATWQLYAVLAGLGVAMSMSLYEPATAVIVSWFDPARRPKALLAMIVVAGFASSIFMPLTGVLEQRYGWRTTLAILGVLYAAVAVPLHAFAVPGSPAPATGQPRGKVRPRLDGRFRFLVLAFVAHSAAMSTMVVHLVGFLGDLGHPATFAATVAGLLGVLSVTGRLLLTGAQLRLTLHRVVAGVFAAQAVAAGALPLVGHSRAGAIVAVVGFGLGFGVASLATPALLAERYGTVGYAGIAGALALPVTLAKATAPTAAAAAGNHAAVLAAVSAACVVAALAMLARAGTAPPPSGVRPVTDRRPADAAPGPHPAHS